MFDVFLVIYREGYFGADDGTSDSKMVYEICKRLAKLRMEWRTISNSRLMIDAPDELYEKYIGIVPSLPDGATVWPLPLCNTYFSGLVIPLQDKMEDNYFRMPMLHGLTIKTLQLCALRIVRSVAV